MADWLPVTVAAVWVAVTPAQLKSPALPPLPTTSPGSVQPKNNALPGLEICHVRQGREISFSLSCSESKPAGLISAASPRSAASEQVAGL